MRKIVAFFLLLIFSIHMYGYKIFFSFYNTQATQHLESRIDKFQYSDEELTEIAVPLNMPYYSDEPLTTAWGEIEVEGKVYQFAKKKIENNILHVWCIVNKEKLKLSEVENTINKNNNDNQNNFPGTQSFLKLVRNFAMFLQKSGEADRILLPYKSEYLICNTPFCSQFEPGTLCKPPCLL